MNYQAEFEIERETIEEGRTFSAEGMSLILNEMVQWIGASVIDKWNKTGEPPTRAVIKIEMEVQ